MSACRSMCVTSDGAGVLAPQKKNQHHIPFDPQARPIPARSPHGSHYDR